MDTQTKHYERFVKSYNRLNPGKTCPTEEEWLALFEENYEYEKVIIAPSDLLDAFPEALPIIKRNKRILHETYKKSAQNLEFIYDAFLETIYHETINQKERRFWIEICRDLFYIKPLEKMKATITAFERLLRVYEWQRNGGKNGLISDHDIARAKTMPLRSFLSFNASGFALCPFVEEKTPSLKIYPDNRWYCFSCCTGGDSIDFIMLLKKISFIEAVKMLC